MSHTISDKKETFTSGFWGWDSQWYEKVYTHVNGLPTVEIHSKFEQGGHMGEWIARVRGNTKQEAEANAAIMAASKDLYEALNKIKNLIANEMPELIDTGSEDQMALYNSYHIATAALNKANP